MLTLTMSTLKSGSTVDKNSNNPPIIYVDLPLDHTHLGHVY